MGLNSKALPGQRISESAADRNALIDAARAHRNGLVSQQSVISADHRNCSVALVKNSAGVAVSEFRAVALRAPIITAANNESQFLHNLNFLAYVAEAADLTASPQKIGVTLVPLLADSIGDCAVSGIVPCRVNVTNTAHRFASLTSGQQYLTSGVTGEAELVDKAGGTGEQWCLVRLGLGGAIVPGSMTIDGIAEGIEVGTGVPPFANVTTIDFEGVIHSPVAGTALIKRARWGQAGFVSAGDQMFAGWKGFDKLYVYSSTAIGDPGGTTTGYWFGMTAAITDVGVGPYLMKFTGVDGDVEDPTTGVSEPCSLSANHVWAPEGFSVNSDIGAGYDDTNRVVGATDDSSDLEFIKGIYVGGTATGFTGTIGG